MTLAFLRITVRRETDSGNTQETRLISIVGGGLSAYLIYRERSGTTRWDGLIATYWTVWFWLSIAASLGVAVSAVSFYAKRIRAP